VAQAILSHISPAAIMHASQVFPSLPSPAQAWLDVRMKGLNAEDLCHISLGVYTTAGLLPTQGLEECWGEFSDLRVNSKVPFTQAHAKSVLDKQAIVIICNPCVTAEVDLLAKFIAGVDKLGEGAPHLVWMPHTIAPEIRPQSTALAVCRHKTEKYISELGIDGIVNGEPEGIRLALDIRSRVKAAENIVKQFEDNRKHSCEMHQYAEYLQECIETMLWDYARKRICPSIPIVDLTIASGVPSEVMGYVLGKELGKGMFGCVYKLHPKGNQRDTGHGRVIKLMPKSDAKDIGDIKNLKRTIDLMTSISSPASRHINIVQLYNVMHSPSHIMLVMEDGGPENLHQRLHYRAHEDPTKQRPLALSKVKAVILQAIAGVQHLHSTLAVAHRDLKPENMLIRESADGLLLKIADFDTAFSCRTKSQCKMICGTMPFMAPELIMERQYDGRKADMWSMGIVMLELICGISVMERALLIERNRLNRDNKVPLAPNRSSMKKIYDAFASPGSAGRLVAIYCLPESSEIIESMSSALNGMLNVQMGERWDINQLVKHIEQSWAS